MISLLEIMHVVNVVKPFGLLYFDIWWPTPHISVNGDRYFLLILMIIQYFHGYFYLQTWDKISYNFLKFKQMVEWQFNTKIIQVESDGTVKFKPLSNVFENAKVV